MHEKFINCELEITALNDCEDEDLAFMSKKIETILKVVEVNKPKIISDQLGIKVQIDNDNLKDVENILNEGIRVISTTFIKGNKPITVNDLAIPSGYWLCATCNSITSELQIQCSNCNVFRLLESYRNLIENPASVSKQEVEQLKQRREQEKNLICGRDLLTPEVIKMDTSWYIISSAWLSQWKAFIFNRPSKNSCVSSNHTIGVLPPGPISNHTLLVKGQQILRSALKQVVPVHKQ